MQTLLFLSVLKCFHYIVHVPSFIGAQTYCQPALLPILKRIMSRIMRREMGINHEDFLYPWLPIENALGLIEHFYRKILLGWYSQTYLKTSYDYFLKGLLNEKKYWNFYNFCSKGTCYIRIILRLLCKL